MTPLIEDKTYPSRPGPKLKRFYKLFSFIWTFYMLNQLGGANMWRRRVCGGADPTGPGVSGDKGAGFWLVFVTDTLLISHPQVWAPRVKCGPPGEVWGPAEVWGPPGRRQTVLLLIPNCILHSPIGSDPENLLDELFFLTTSLGFFFPFSFCFV